MTTRTFQLAPRVVTVQVETDCACGLYVFNHPAHHPAGAACEGAQIIDFQFELWADANAFALLVEAGILDPSEEAGR